MRWRDDHAVDVDIRDANYMYGWLVHIGRGASSLGVRKFRILITKHAPQGEMPVERGGGFVWAPIGSRYDELSYMLCGVFRDRLES